MVGNEARLKEVAGVVLGALGYELLDLSVAPRGKRLVVQLWIDRLDGQGGVTVGDCARASKALGADLGVSDCLPGAYVLEVSSPGVNRPLTRPAHFQRFVGETAVIRLNAGTRRSLTGTIALATAGEVCVALESGETVTIQFDDIQSAHLKVDPWKRTKSPSTST